MKTSLLLIQLGLIIGACRTQHQSALSEWSEASSENEALPSRLIFSEDARPADGALTEVILTKIEGSAYNVKVHTATNGGFSGESTDHTRDLGSLDCIIARDRSKRISKVACAFDARPVDGVLTELTLVAIKGQLDSYKAKLRIASNGGFDGEPSDQTEDLGRSLDLVSSK